MHFTIVSGHSGSGKTAYLIDQVVARTRAGEKCLFLVPESATFDYEQALSAKLGGLLRAQVLGFARLSTRVLEQAGGRTRTFLSEEGKRMVLRKLIDQNAAQLSLYAKVSPHSGFAEKLEEIIALLKHDCVSAAQLAQAASQTQDSLLQSKLQDIALLYARFEEFTQGELIDVIDAQALFAQKLPETEFLRDTHIFIDSLHAFSFTKQIYNTVYALLRHCKSVHVCLRQSRTSDAHARLFAQDTAVCGRLTEHARNMGAQVDEIYLPRITRPMPPAVQSIEQYLFCDIQDTFQPQGLTLFDAPTPLQEVDAAIAHILNLILHGAACREIVIAVGDETLSPMLARALQARGLPYFLDKPRPLATHSVVEGLLCAMQCVMHKYAQQDVLRVAKSGFHLQDEEQAEIFCDYTLRYGIAYTFKKPFTKGALKYESFAAAEQARQRLITPLLALEERLKGATTGHACAKALFYYMQEIQLGEQLESACAQLNEQGEYELAAQNAQVYHTLLALLDQIALLLGDVTPEQCQAVLEEGLLACEIGLIPPQNDSILLCDIARASARNASHLLVLGANEGCILPPAKEAIFNDQEIERLESLGIEAFKSSALGALNDKNTVYACLSRATHSLYVSYSLCDLQAKAQQSDTLTERLHAMFPMASHPQSAHADSKRVGFSNVLRDLRRLMSTGNEADGLRAAMAYFLADAHYAPALKQALTLLCGLDDGLQPQLAKKLCGTWEQTSVSRLERFNNCPFAHLMTYGIRPQENRPYTLQALDEGNFYHAVFDAFFKQLQEEGIAIAQLQRQDCDGRIQALCEVQFAAQNEGLLQSNERHQILAQRLTACAKRTMWAIVNQINAGDFLPIGTEVVVGEQGTGLQLQLAQDAQNTPGRTITLMGKIDRIDAYHGYVRIIDYKTGGQKPELTDLFHGTKLQLPLYLAACREIGQGAGIFTLHVHDPIREIENKPADQDDGAQEEAQEQKAYKMSGFVVDDVQIVRAMDKSAQGFSTVIPVRFTKQGVSGTAVISKDVMNLITDYACCKATGTVRRILDGENAPAPVKRAEKTACDYCVYYATCRYEGQKKGFPQAARVRDTADFVRRIDSSLK